MVCLGNICRSPIAEGLLRDRAGRYGLDWMVDSAGTNGYHTGKPPHRHSQEVCLRHGIDISEQRARRFEKKDLARYDKIYVMAGDVYRDVQQIAGKGADLSNVDFFLNELHPGTDRSVPDPWYGDKDGYLPVYKMIEQACDIIIRKYGAGNAIR